MNLTMNITLIRVECRPQLIFYGAWYLYGLDQGKMRPHLKCNITKSTLLNLVSELHVEKKGIWLIKEKAKTNGSVDSSFLSNS